MGKFYYIVLSFSLICINVFTAYSRKEFLLPYEFATDINSFTLRETKTNQALDLLKKGKSVIETKYDLDQAYEELMSNSDLITDFKEIEKINRAYQYLRQIFKLREELQQEREKELQQEREKELQQEREKEAEFLKQFSDDDRKNFIKNIEYVNTLKEDKIPEAINNNLCDFGLFQFGLVNYNDVKREFNEYKMYLDANIISMKKFNEYKKAFLMLSAFYKLGKFE
jgi:hypothetical protein